VTPEEIRAIQQNPYPVKGELTLNDATFYVLREIAAQLAEQNQQFRDDRLQRKVWRDEEQAASKKRDEIMAGLAEKQSQTMENLTPPQLVRVDRPGAVTHLGCIIREPDGAYKIATNTGELLELSEADFQRIFAPPVPPEAKPQ
jgi:hypothetical protein